MSQTQTFSPAFLMSVLRRRKLPAASVFGAVVASACLFALVAPREYEATSRLVLGDRKESVSELGRELAEVSEVGQSAEPIANQAELITSGRVLDLTRESLEASGSMEAAEEATPSNLRQNLEIDILPATNILKLTYTSHTPELAAKTLDALANAVVQENSETIRAQAAKVGEFLKERIPEVEQRLKRIELEEQRYRQSTGVVSLPDQTQSLVDSLAELEKEDRTLSAQLQETGARINSLRQVTDVNSLDRAYAAVRAGQDESLDQLRTRLTELSIQEREIRSRVTDEHPEMRALKDEQAGVQRLYRDRLTEQLPSQQRTIPAGEIATQQVSQDLISELMTNEIQFAALNQRLREVKTGQTQLQQTLTDLPQKQQTLAQLLRQREEAEASLKLLQNKLEEARIAESQLISQVRVVDQAQTPTRASWPNFPVVLLLAIASGLVLAAGTVVLLEIVDDRVYDIDDIRSLTKLPILGAIPDESAGDSMAPVQDFLNDQVLVESYRKIIKKIESSTRKQSNCIVVTSVQSDDANSVFAAHLAVVAATLSRKTLLIDANLRQPVQHQLFGLAASPGTREVVEGAINLRQAAQTVGIENLAILNAGEQTSNPSALIESGAMKELLSESFTQFDWVIIDTPSSADWSDAITLGHYSDGLALLVSPNTNHRNQLKEVATELRSSNVPVLGVIVAQQGDAKLSVDHPEGSNMPPDSSTALPSLNSEEFKPSRY